MRLSPPAPLSAALVLAAGIVVALVACGSKPVYPACTNDGACTKGEHHDYCVAGTCAQCRTAGDCGDRERCRAAKCEADPDAPPPPEPVEAGPPPDEPPPPPPRPKRRRYYEE